MNFKLSISILISSAYFLTLFIVKVLKTQDIMGTIMSVSIYSVFLFLAIYILLQYIEYSFENLKRKESQDALAQIERIEKEFKMKQRKDLDNRLKELIEQEENTDLYDYDDEDDDYENNDDEDEFEEDEFEEDELKKLKRDSGTQFDSRFIEQGGPNI